MKIASLDPGITDTLFFLGLKDQICAVSHRCETREGMSAVPRVTAHYTGAPVPSGFFYDERIPESLINIADLAKIRPDIIVAPLRSRSVHDEFTAEKLAEFQGLLSSKLGYEVKLLRYGPNTLEDIFEQSERLAKSLKVNYQLCDLGKRVKAQLMDWGDNFYERMKNKKVTFLSSVSPLKLGGYWIPDMITALSAQSQSKVPPYEHGSVEWKEILEYRPDVVVVAPKDLDLKSAMGTFKVLEKLPGWEEIPAVKRGEVVFTDGLAHFYNAGPKIISSFGILVSAIAGLESGFITERDSFYRLRWLEIQRHRF